MKKLIVLIAFGYLFFASTPQAGHVIRKTASGTSCTATIYQLDTNDYWTISNPTCQKIKNSSALTICQVDIYIYAGSGNAHVEIWSDANATGTQYGADSDSQYIDGGAIYSFTWSSTEPNPTGDFFLHLNEEDGSISWQAHTDENKYEDTNYDAWRGGAEITGDNDFRFKVYTR